MSESNKPEVGDKVQYKSGDDTLSARVTAVCEDGSVDLMVTGTDGLERAKSAIPCGEQKGGAPFCVPEPKAEKPKAHGHGHSHR